MTPNESSSSSSSYGGQTTASAEEPDALALFEEALDFIERGWYRRAITNLQQVTFMEPGNADAWNELGFSYRNVENYRQSEAAYTRALGLDPESALTAIVERLPEAEGTRLAARAAELRELVHRSRREQSVVKAAGDALSRHMAGIVQSVSGALSGTGVYGRRGRLRDGVPVVAGLDLTS